MLTLRGLLKVKVRFARAGAVREADQPLSRQLAGIQVEHHMDHFDSTRTLIAGAVLDKNPKFLQKPGSLVKS